MAKRLSIARGLETGPLSDSHGSTRPQESSVCLGRAHDSWLAGKLAHLIRSVSHGANRHSFNPNSLPEKHKIEKRTVRFLSFLFPMAFMHIIGLILHKACLVHNFEVFVYTTGCPSPVLPGTCIHAFLQAHQDNDSHWPTTARIRIVLPLVDICLQMNRHRLSPRSEIAEAPLRRDAWPKDLSVIIFCLLGPRSSILQI